MKESNNLKLRWNQTLKKAKILKATSSTFQDILNAYNNSGRFYHTTNHLQHCFNILDLMMENIPEISAIELALWYHDFIYDTHRNDNEEVSSIIAFTKLTKELGVSNKLAEQVRKFIIETNHKSEPQTLASKILLDIDLSILGETSEKYWNYEKNIKKEYSWVEDNIFNQVRRKLLKKFQDKKYIYHTLKFQNSIYESRAKENIKNALDKLI